MTRPTSFQHVPPVLAALVRNGPYLAVIDYWHDGDTFFAEIDAGFAEYPFRSIRIAGINAPEITATDPVIRAAADASLVFCQQSWPSGTQIVLSTGNLGQSFDRWVASIMTTTGDMADEIVAAGHAVPWSRTQWQAAIRKEQT